LDQVGPAQPLVMKQEGKRLEIRMLSQNGRTILLLNEKTNLYCPTINSDALAATGLSSREAEVLIWVARGRTNFEIGQILRLSARTVQKHLEHVFQKLGVETRTAAAARAWELARESMSPEES
jgi:ATP/maltotriose-dependent transcriptional regulator MalT